MVSLNKIKGSNLAYALLFFFLSFPAFSQQSCTETNPNTPFVKELYKNLIDKILDQPQGTITNGFTCPELTDLAPYITDPNPAIYNYTRDELEIKFSFAPHELSETDPDQGYDVVLNFGGELDIDSLGDMTDVDLSGYISDKDRLDYIPSFFENGWVKMDIQHINFCPDTIEDTYCINEALSLYFEYEIENTYTYTWTIIDLQGNIIISGTDPNIVFTPEEEGIFEIRLVITDANKCVTRYNKVIWVKDCTPQVSCTLNNPNTTVISGLFKNLINKLITLQAAAVPDGYSCPELAELAPYITDSEAKIYNFINTGNYVSFSFAEHDAGDNDILIPYQAGLTITGFNLDNFFSAENTAYITANFSNGTSDSSKPKVRHINFCANQIISCTDSNPRSPRVKQLFIALVNHLKERAKAGLTIPDGYTCPELNKLKFYMTEPESVYIYNFNQVPFRFSFHPTTGEDYDVSIPDLASYPNETLQSANLNYYTTASTYTDLDWKLTMSSGTKLRVAKVRHINFCPDEICVNHVAIVVDESGSIDNGERLKIRRQLFNFVQQQGKLNDDLDGNMRISLIGMSDSDTRNLRTDHKLEIKPTQANTSPGGILYEWINNYGTRYNVSATDGISEGSDFWKSGLDVATSNSFNIKPNMVIMITDGSQTDDLAQLKQTMMKFNNYGHLGGTSKPHLFVVGLKNGYYTYDKVITTGKLAQDKDPNYNPELYSSASTSTSRVTPALSLSLRYLLGLEEINEFPDENQNDFTKDYVGLEDFALLRDDTTYFSDKISKAKIGCGEQSIKDSCDDCYSFKPERGKYVLSAWVKEETREQKTTYSGAQIKLIFKNRNEEVIGEKVFSPTIESNIIDGWQRIGDLFEIPFNEFAASQQTAFIEFELINGNPNNAVYFDDIRIHPAKGSMKAFVYDPENFRLMSELDENNYSTFYEYDNQGGLVRIKKETAQGVKTIQETRSGNVIKND